MVTQTTLRQLVVISNQSDKATYTVICLFLHADIPEQVIWCQSFQLLIICNS